MDPTDSGAREPLDEPDADVAPGSLPVEAADNGEPVLDPDADEDEAGEAAAADVERREGHRRSHDDR